MQGDQPEFEFLARPPHLSVEFDGSQVQGFLFRPWCSVIIRRTCGPRLHSRKCRFGQLVWHVDRPEPSRGIFGALKLFIYIDKRVLWIILDAFTSSPVGVAEGAGGGFWASLGRTKIVLGFGGK